MSGSLPLRPSLVLDDEWVSFGVPVGVPPGVPVKKRPPLSDGVSPERAFNCSMLCVKRLRLHSVCVCVCTCEC